VLLRPDLHALRATLTYQGFHSGIAEYLVREHPIAGMEDPII
jgi:hypothetical protein